MTGAISDGSQTGVSGQGRRRPRRPVPRTRRMEVTLTGEEYTVIEAAARQVRRIGTNISQAAAKLNATGQPAGDLPVYAAETIRRAGHIDAVADAVRKALG